MMRMIVITRRKYVLERTLFMTRPTDVSEGKEKHVISRTSSIDSLLMLDKNWQFTASCRSAPPSGLRGRPLPSIGWH